MDELGNKDRNENMYRKNLTFSCLSFIYLFLLYWKLSQEKLEFIVK